ncbi:MAG TPA: hypothetical protein VNI52_05390 [Sphingobacteriaceae bacterium]|nr:hypothetical protein [Sphingobacteriaceae bacterium]
MKQFYLFGAALLLVVYFCSAPSVLAQSLPAGAETDNSFNDRMNYIFSPLEKNRVPYGLLQDYAMEFTSIENFNGTAALTDSNVVDYAAYWDIYQTLFTSRIHSNAGSWQHPVLLDSLWLQERTPGRLALAGLCVGYARFKPDAASNNQVSVSNDQIYDQYISGNWIDPYNTDIAFALTPAVDSYNGRRFEVILPSSTWTSNQSISSIQFDPNDGSGYRTLSLNQPSLVHYADTGVKTWTYQVNLSDGRILYSHSRIHIDFAVDPADDQVQSQFSTFSLPSGPQAITASESFDGKTAQGFITIRYANPNDPQLRRPLIVAEGFDPGHIIKPEEKYGVNNVSQFLKEIRVLDLNVLKEIILTNPQYDLIYVDWKKGTDNIFRNAKLLKEVIRLVNQNKVMVNGVKEPNVIIGQSMGGLITRIALKEMENANENHETRLFISHDAPHQGANVPLAYQHMGRHARNIYISTGPVALGVEVIQLIRGSVSPLLALSLANQPASRQMLVNYINDFGNLNNSVHDNFQQQLQNIGYPQTRNVSLSNGSECAQSQDLQPGGSLVSILGKISTRFLGDLAFTAVSHFASKLLPRSRIFRLGTLPGKNTFQAEVQLNATANGGSNRVYYMDIRYTKKIFYLINIDVVLMSKTKYAPSGLLPHDSYPGGTITLPDFQLNTSYQNWFYKYSIAASNNPTFMFKYNRLC